ncbi:iron-sulfur cluster co-chaperone HscB C-terminal domain-containing protein [Flavihumibacter petaseus]|uniref:Co-chaperone protein HscB n=1 Tax=Flavihumibacter petaseus NBRC 106054 TaxID=1220578 RepID=A0A0E9N4I6_9BACT|nr:iron-sulfur cluster co-chaperone HscB C-terminal domain-containing protein [Flavihumibacter petaseus]GAO44744.1 co-chaperone protein HscB [Flavihumibacter petaseus NBRC 106054]
MNYYELYGIPVGFRVDPALLKKRFYELSRQYHPDFYTQEDPSKQVEALEISSQVNKAYKAFQHEDTTIQYLLTQKGLMEAEEKYSLDPMFLGEVLEINEALMDLEMDPDPIQLAKVQTDTDTLLKNIYHDVEPILAGYQEGVTSEEALLQVKEYYYRKKYLQRILDKIAALRNIATRQ